MKLQEFLDRVNDCQFLKKYFIPRSWLVTLVDGWIDGWINIEIR
jgi:hypothetical protein